MRSTGDLHLGHLHLILKAKNYIKLNPSYQIMFLLADQHGIINNFLNLNEKNLKDEQKINFNTINIIKSLISLGFSTKQILLSSYLR